MKRCYWLIAGIAILFALNGCKSTEEEIPGYKVLVMNEDGDVLENASVTPKVTGHNFKTKFTGIDGTVDLNAMYSEKPKFIMVRAISYRSQSVPWKLPSLTPQVITLKKLVIPEK